MAFQMATTLTQVAADSPQAFGHAITSGAYAKYCQVAYGIPSAENIGRATQVGSKRGVTYWVDDRGNAALGFVRHGSP